MNVFIISHNFMNPNARQIQSRFKRNEKVDIFNGIRKSGTSLGVDEQVTNLTVGI